MEQNRCTANFFGHMQSVTQLLFSVDGKKMYSASYDGSVREWSLASGDHLRTINVDYTISKIALSPDEQSVLIGQDNDFVGKITEVDINSGKVLNGYYFHNGSISLIEYLPDGERFISYASSENDPYLIIWEKGNTKPINLLKLNEECKIHSLSTDKKKLFILHKSGEIIESVFDFNLFFNGSRNVEQLLKPLIVYKGHTAEVRDLFHHPLQNKMLSSSSDGTIKEWSTESEKCLQTYKADMNDFKYKHGLNPKAIYWGNKNDIASTVAGDILYVWKSGSKKPIQSIRVQPGVIIDGLDLRNVVWKNELTEAQKKELGMYGAIL